MFFFDAESSAFLLSQKVAHRVIQDPLATLLRVLT